jgi:hypothetical protein
MIQFITRHVHPRASFFFIFFSIALLTTGQSRIALGADRSLANPLESENLQALRKTLGRTCSVSFKNGNLRSSVASLEKEYSLRIWLDARVDLDVSSDFVSSGTTVAKALESLADSRQAGPIWIGDIIYVSPKETASAIESAYWRLYRSWPPAELYADEFAWTVPSSPRELLENWGKRNRWEIVGLDTIEHDLWSASSLPQGNTPAQLACLLSGLGLEARIEPTKRVLTLNSMGKDESFEYAYPHEKIDSKLVASWKKLWPGATILRNGNMQVIKASPAAHRDLVAYPLSPKPLHSSGKDPLALERFNLKFKGRLLTVLEELRRGPKIVFEPWPLPKSIEDSTVDTNFKNATIDDVLKELGQQAKIGFQRDGLNVSIELP